VPAGTLILSTIALILAIAAPQSQAPATQSPAPHDELAGVAGASGLRGLLAWRDRRPGWANTRRAIAAFAQRVTRRAISTPSAPR
jgi:hypothetical protein